MGVAAEMAAAVAVAVAERDRITDQSQGPNVMFRKTLNVLMAVALLFAASVHAKEPIRIDATSDATATATFERMTSSLSPRKQQTLQIAVLLLNMEGVSSAYEVVDDPASQRPSIARIRDKVSGMSADEIIALSKRVKTVHAIVPSDQAK
jgi:hypothetical protein